MATLAQACSVPWYTSRPCRTTALLMLALVGCAQAGVAIGFRDNDFLWHRWVGQDFLTGTLYGGVNVSYPISRALMDAALAVAPYRLTRAISFCLALGALSASYRIWRRLAEASAPAPEAITSKTALRTGLLLLPFLLRDLDECGLQLFLLFFLSAALSALVGGRHGRAGFWLATAVIYKATPVLFLPLLLGKRQWRAAGWTVVFLVVWAAAPIPFMGLEKTVAGHQAWLAHIRRVSAARKAYPDPLVEPQRIENLALPALLARNLETYPPGHPLYLDHPLFLQFGALTPEDAYRAVWGVLLGLGLLLAWRFRRPWTESAASAGLAVEWATVGVLCALLSPMCWSQHLVLALPAAFLLVRGTLVMQPPPRWRVAVLVGIGLLLNLTRDAVLGRELSAVLLSYKVDTIFVLVILVLLLTLPSAARAAPGASHAVALPVLSR